MFQSLLAVTALAVTTTANAVLVCLTVEGLIQVTLLIHDPEVAAGLNCSS